MQNSPSDAPTTKEINTEMMNATFMLVNQNSGQGNLGTGFLVGRKVPNDLSRLRVVLVTAAHVLDGMIGDSMSLVMRKRIGSAWEANHVEIKIRSQGEPLWQKHAQVDVAAMYLPAIPPDLSPQTVPPVDGLANEQALIHYEIHPGDELSVLGYPLGTASSGGFPILRSGKIASYPLVPTSEHPFFFLDFRIFKGNSGGPVYFSQNNRAYGGNMYIGGIHFIMGLVSEEMIFTEQSQGQYESSVKETQLGLAKIIPAPYIAQTIEMLPPPLE